MGLNLLLAIKSCLLLYLLQFHIFHFRKKSHVITYYSYDKVQKRCLQLALAGRVA